MFDRDRKMFPLIRGFCPSSALINSFTSFLFDLAEAGHPHGK
jgi:hypothetical protein